MPRTIKCRDRRAPCDPRSHRLRAMGAAVYPAARGNFHLGGHRRHGAGAALHQPGGCRDPVSCNGVCPRHCWAGGPGSVAADRRLSGAAVGGRRGCRCMEPHGAEWRTCLSRPFTCRRSAGHRWLRRCCLRRCLWRSVGSCWRAASTRIRTTPHFGPALPPLFLSYSRPCHS